MKELFVLALISNSLLLYAACKCGCNRTSPNEHYKTSKRNAPDAYDTYRFLLEVKEQQMAEGGQLQLNSKEEKVNEMFMRMKSAELERGYQNSSLNAPALHYFKAKPLIEDSNVFKFLQKMPKGASLHLHANAAVSVEWLAHQLATMPELLKCKNKNNVTILTFRQAESLHQCRTSYTTLNHRKKGRRVQYLKRMLTLYPHNSKTISPNSDEMWKRLQNIFTSIRDVLRYLPMFRLYHRRLLEELFSDNIIYAELRTTFYQVYDENGTMYSDEFVVRELQSLESDFKKKQPGFIGYKLIVAIRRNKSRNEIKRDYENFLNLHAKFPDFVIGLDFVGKEDKGLSLNDLKSMITNFPQTAYFFFHAGETNGLGSTTDGDLYDAVLLKSKRVGHAFAVVKHPLLMMEMKRRKIAVEVCPISSQILHFEGDMRNHPAAILLANGVPVVICNDDPGFWQAKGLSYDYYYAIMSLASNNAGLQLLKQLVGNSLLYATFPKNMKKNILDNFDATWQKFIDDSII